MKKKNRWFIALATIFIHLSIGSVYAYSVFKNPITEKLGWSATQVSFAFTIAIFFLGMSAALFGRLVERMGPGKSSFIAAVLFSTGLIGAGYTIQMESLYGFYLFYGVIGGVGLGFGYIAPVSTLIKWFPDRRGLATGMAVFGFGAGSLIASPVMAKLIVGVGIAQTFYICGFIYFVLMLIGALYIEKPKDSPSKDNQKAGLKNAGNDLSQMNAKEAIKTKRFWYLWVMMFINISAGIMIISVASPMAQEKVGMSVLAAASMVGIMGMFNGGGRLGWASLSDYTGRLRIYILFFAFQFVAFALLPSVSNAMVFQCLIFIILTMYGGGFACLPAFIGDLFGTKQLGAIHGLLLTSWSMAGVVGPLAVAYIKEQTNSYNMTFYLFAGLLFVSLVTSILLKGDMNRVKMKNATLQKAS